MGGEREGPRMITTIYHSPLGDISLAATARGLAGLWFREVDCAPSMCADSACFDMNGGGLIDPDPAATVEEIEGCDALSGARPMCASSPAHGSAIAVLERSWAWLNAYFAGQAPRWVPPMDFGGDDFEHAVCVALLGVPYGEAVTVDDVAASVASRIGGAPDVRAVHEAALRCPVRVIVPAHRVEGLLAPDDPRECVSVALRALEAAR